MFGLNDHRFFSLKDYSLNATDKPEDFEFFQRGHIILMKSQSYRINVAVAVLFFDFLYQVGRADDLERVRSRKRVLRRF